jgi:hypothetical protein
MCLKPQHNIVEHQCKATTGHYYFLLQSNLNPTEAPSDVDTKAIVDTERRDWPWKKAKKVAVMISFCGKDYIGMQRFHKQFQSIFIDLVKLVLRNYHNI